MRGAAGSLVALVLAVFAAGAAQAAPPLPVAPLGCEPPTAGRVALWRGEGTAQDSVRGLDGTLTNGLGYAPGVLGQAFSLPGDSDHVTVPDAEALDITGDLTLDTWVRIDDTNFANPDAHGIGGDRALFWKVDAGDLLLTYSLFIDGETLDTPLAFVHGDRRQPGGRAFSRPLQWQADRWYHVAAARSGGTVTFYRDGEPVGTDALGQGAIATPGAPLALGAAPLPDAVYNPLKGDLDETGIWSRALSAGEVRAIDDTATGVCRRPPDTTIDSGPSGPSATATPTFTFSSDDRAATFECRLDGAGFAPCVTPRTTAALAPGDHRFEVRAVDDRGTPDPTPAARAFTVAEAVPAAPRNAGLPLIVNTAERYVYRCLSGNWEGRDPARPYTYTWQRLTPDKRYFGGLRTDDVATGDTYRPVQGPPVVNPPSMFFRCVVQASSAGGSTAALSPARTLEPAPRPQIGDPPGTLAAKVEGIEITQAVQTHDQPRATSYNGVALVRGKTTVVRVFADLRGRVGRGLATLGMALYATDDAGRSLPGSPLAAQWSPDRSTLSLNDDRLTEAERNSPTSAFTFVLPDTWTRGRLRLQARALGAGLCLQTACGATPARTLSDIDFRPPPPAAAISALKQIVFLHADKPPQPGVPPAPDPNGKIIGISEVTATPAQIFAKLRALSPVPFQFFDGAGRSADLPRFRSVGFASDIAIWEPADAYDEEIGRPGLATIGVFVLGGNPGVAIGHTAVASGRTLSPGVLWRPVTSVAHEVFHTMRFSHASTGCGAGDGEAWPVADGRMDSVGIDTTPGSGGPGAPYRMIADTDASPTYDLMSYCGIVAGDAPHWISAHNWNRALGILGNANRARGAAARPAAADTPWVRDALVVRAQVAGGGVEVLTVASAKGPPPPEPEPSPYSLVARDAAGRALATVPVSRYAGTGAAGTAPVISLQARVPSAGVARIDILAADGTVVAGRAASASAPVARILAPALGRRVGDRATVAVRWQASDADGDGLAATLDVSSDGGRTFHNVWSGPAGAGAAQLPTALLDATTDARLRLRVSDGFHESRTTSARFAVVSRRPEVEILEPAASLRSDAGGAVALRGAAVDDRGRQLTGSRLRWFAGDTLIGRGATVSAALPAGTRRVRLEATDAAGRSASRSIGVRVRATPPLFVRLSAPPLSRSARSAVLVVAATQPSTLAIRGQRHRVGPRVRRIRVPVGAGRGGVRLTLTLTAGGASSARTVVVRRARG